MDGFLNLFDNAAVVIAVSVALVLALAALIAMSLRVRNLRQSNREERAKRHQIERQFEAITVDSRDGIVIIASSGDVAMVSARAQDILQLDPSVLTRPLVRLPIRAVDENMRPLLMPEVFLPAIGQNETIRVVGVPGRRGENDVRWLHVHTRIVSEALETGSATVVTLGDVGGYHDGGDGVARTDSHYRKAVENAPIGMALVDLDWQLTSVNRAFAELMGSTVIALQGKSFTTLSHPQDLEEERAMLEKILAGQANNFSMEKRYIRADGTVVWAVLDVSLVRKPGGAPDYYVAQVRDYTEDRVHSEMLAHRAMHDPLTGLANRSLLNDVLQQSLAAPDAVDRLGVMVVDLDGFKALNDRLGHAVGDAALVHVASVLTNAVAGRGTVARLGGDEFIVVVQDTNRDVALHDVAAAIHQGLRAPLQVKKHQLSLQGSVGIAAADDEMIAGGAQALLAAADLAMYRAKALGKSRTEVFEPSMRSAGDQSVMASELTAAIQQNELVLHFQPIVDLVSRTPVGYEALVRWQHPTRGLLLPGAFLHLFGDDRALLGALTKTVMNQAADFLTKIEDQRVWVTLNVSAGELVDGTFAANLSQVLSRKNLVPQRVVVELTEQSLVSEDARVRHQLTELRQHGIAVLLDDFGTGVSPLSYLRDLPVSGVKLDMSFVAGIPDDPAGVKVSRALGAMARELQLVTIAEGIETEDQADFLAGCGWRYGQGWLFGIAQPPSALI